MKLFSRLLKDVSDDNDRNANVQAQSDNHTNSNNQSNSNDSIKNNNDQNQNDSSQKEHSKNNNMTSTSSNDETTALTSVHDQRVKIENDMNSLSHEYAQLRGKLKLNLFSERDDYQNKKNSLTKQLNALKKNEKAVQDNIEKNQNENDGKETERLAGVRADQKHQNELLYKYKEQQKDLAQKIEKGETKRSKKQAELDANQKKETDLSASIKNETDLQKMMSLMEKQKSQVDKIYKDRTNIEKDLRKIRDEIGVSKKDLNDVNININEISSTVSLLKTKIGQQEQNIKNNKARRSQLIAQLQASSKTNNNEINGLELQLKNVNDNIEYVDKYIKDVFHAAYLVREVYLDSSKEYLVVSNSIDNEQKESDLFDMIGFLERKMNTGVTIVTSFYNNKFQSIVDGYTKSMRIDQPKVINLFADLQKSDNPSDKKVTIPESDSWITRTDVETQNTLIYDKQENLMMTVEHFEEKIDRINYFKNSKIVKTNIYNADGILSSVEIFDKSQKLTEENFYRTDGSIVLTIMYESGVANTFQVFDQSGLLQQDFDKKEELVTWWINKLYQGKSDIVFVGSSTDLLYKVVAGIRDQENTELITFVENAHSNIGRIKALLHKEPLIDNIFVQYEKDLHAIENTTDRDISVSSIKSVTNEEMYLPESLKI
ncbi:coiled-coil domain-containing protein [Companilactobacillus mishanensis]|uniref:DUF2326 domain-containing protein n=1 Tax=Companilactobacillus mishanensis TaxID=2486008 RepID=A0ABW9P7E6_9LACO|nr:hypothetical protein [Companilactobacillus mishanensis]MQS45083.1 hypothetical protein [Companilactobacillus mishanensis]